MKGIKSKHYNTRPTNNKTTTDIPKWMQGDHNEQMNNDETNYVSFHLPGDCSALIKKTQRSVLDTKK